MHKLGTFIKRLFVGIGLLALLFIGAGVAITFIYADKVESLVVAELNKQLLRPVELEKLSFSFLNKFPKASVEITKVKVQGLKEEDPLFIESEKIYLAFDLFSLLQDNIEINEIDIENAVVDVLINKKGEVNYKIFKEKAESEGGSILDLNMVHIINTKLNYRDLSRNLIVKTHSFNSSIHASFGSLTNVMCDWDGDVLALEIGKTSFPVLTIKGQVKVKTDGNRTEYGLHEAVLYDQEINVKGSYDSQAKEGLTDFDVPNGSLEKLLELLPKQVRLDLKRFELQGSLSLSGSIKQSGSGNLELESSFKASRAKIIVNNQLKLSKLKLHGGFAWKDLRKPASAILDLKSFGFEIGGNSITGSGQLLSIDNPKLNVNLKGKLDLAYVSSKLGSLPITIKKGQLEFDTRLIGNLKNATREKGLEVLKHLKSTGDIQLNDLRFTSKGIRDEFSKVTGKIKFNHEHIRLIGFSGELNETHFELDGSVLHYLKSWLEQQPTQIEARVKADQLQLESFIDDSKKGGDAYYFNLPSNLDLSLDLELGAFTFQRFKARAISGKVKMARKILTMKHLSFSSCGGQTMANGTIVASYPNKVVFEADMDLQNIDVSTAFEQLNNFGQQFLLARHVKGKLTTHIYLLAETDKSLKVNEDQLFVQSDIQITQGELNQFEPLMELEQYLKGEFNISLALSDLKFNELKNTIRISNRKISIPNMNIRSSALDLEIAGYHTFDQEIYYLLKIKANEIFKAKNRNAIDAKYGVVEHPGNTSTLPLLMKGTVEEPVFTYDVAAKKEIVKENLKEEGQEVKKAFSKEIKEILGQKDTTVDRQKEKDKHTKIKVIWDEE